MPPKHPSLASAKVSSNVAADGDSTNTAARDQWSANPYKSTDPRREQYEVQQRISQRKAAVSRVGHTIAKDLRTHDFAIGGVVMGRNTTSAEFVATQKRQSADASSSRAPSVAADGAALTHTTIHQTYASRSASVLTDKNNNINTTTAAGGGYTISETAGGEGASPKSDIDLTTVPSRLRAPTSYVEEALSIEGLTCSIVLQGGSLILVGTRAGEIVALSGFTNAELAKVSVEEPIQLCDNELSDVARREGGDPDRRPQRKARRGDAEAHAHTILTKLNESKKSEDSIANGGDTTEKSKSDPLAQTGTYDDSDALRGTTRRDPDEKSGNEGAYPIAVGALGESSFVAFVLSNKKVRVFDAMSLVAVDEISFETDEERQRRAAEKEKGESSIVDGMSSSNDSNARGVDSPLPFAAVLPVDCAPDPLIFFVACSDRVVAFNLHQPRSLAERPRLVITRIKTYEKLGLRLVSAATDSARTIVYAGDDKGGVWTIDVGDLMVIDSWPAVPPPPPPPNTKREQRRAAAAATRLAAQRASKEESGAESESTAQNQNAGPIETATAVGAFEEFVFIGTSAGRVVVSQKQPYGEKPLTILDEEKAHEGRIIGAVADERAKAVWFASELGEITCWALTSQRLIYRTVVPTCLTSEEKRGGEGGQTNKQPSSSAALLTSFAMLPHAITNKIWAITISGINKVWIAEDHQTHDEMGVAHTHMESILHRQESAMQQKEEEVEAAERLMLERLQKIVDAMAEQNRQRVLRAYYCAWVKARLKAITWRKREDAAEALHNNAVYHLARSYYLKLIANMTSKREGKQNQATIAHLRTQREDELRGRYFNSLRKYVQERRAAEHKTTLAIAVAGINNASSVGPFYFDKWRRFADTKRKAKLQKKYMDLVTRVEGRRLALSFFLRWQSAVGMSKLLVEQRRTVAIIADGGRFRSLRGLFTAWQSFLEERKSQRLRMKWCAFMMRSEDYKLLAKAFDAIMRYRLQAERARKVREISAAEEKKALLEKSFTAVAPIVDRREKVKALQDRIAALKAQRASLLKDEAAVSSHNKALRERINSVPNPIIDSVTAAVVFKSKPSSSVSAQKPSTSPSDTPHSSFADAPVQAGAGADEEEDKNTPFSKRVSLLKLFGRLRSSVINLEKDASAITRVLSKAKVDSVVTTFDSYFSDLKATVHLLAPKTGGSDPTAVNREGEAVPTASSIRQQEREAHEELGGAPQSQSLSFSSSPSSTTHWPSDEPTVMRLVARAEALQGPLLVTIKAIVIAFDALSSSEVNTLARSTEGSELIANADAIVLLAELLQQAVVASNVAAAKRRADSPPPSPSKGGATPRTRLI